LHPHTLTFRQPAQPAAPERRRSPSRRGDRMSYSHARVVAVHGISIQLMSQMGPNCDMVASLHHFRSSPNSRPSSAPSAMS
jgi:hypothetical protein